MVVGLERVWYVCRWGRRHLWFPIIALARVVGGRVKGG